MKKRASGILLHISSLPSRYGIGDFGPDAYTFVDFLSEARQSYWQILPLNPTDAACGNSPYSSNSAFAGNILFISPDLLIKEQFLSPDEIEPLPDFPARRCEYAAVTEYKMRLYSRAFEKFSSQKKRLPEYEKFCTQHSYWLEDYALFVVIKRVLGGKSWDGWPESLRDRKTKDLNEFKKQHSGEIEKEKFLQFIFFRQWYALKKYCKKKGVKIIGDMPIYVSYDSAEVWKSTGVFKLDAQKKPTHVAGVPPDYFSSTGQLWGNPLYRWNVMKQKRFTWWMTRMEHNLSVFDIVRIDHFRGLVAYWQVPAGETTAINGEWVKAPIESFLNTLRSEFSPLPIIAEDLGLITDDVREIMKKFKLPGMKVLLFAFGEDNPRHPYLPRNYEKNCIAYTGTHDNNTARGWFEHEAGEEELRRVGEFLGAEATPEGVAQEFIGRIMDSRANTVIFPIQDILGLGEDCRMNVPSVAKGNWEWRLRAEEIGLPVKKYLSELTKKTQRAR
ncbi:MAG: 4-alpha-glucanotransferase [Candidatus Omnitrophica bacterium]|nr:4-alpha-glucanotransferase [Candidatus Omnitrophota bacterium]